MAESNQDTKYASLDMSRVAPQCRILILMFKRLKVLLKMGKTNNEIN